MKPVRFILLGARRRGMMKPRMMRMKGMMKNTRRETRMRIVMIIVTMTMMGTRRMNRNNRGRLWSLQLLWE